MSENEKMFPVGPEVKEALATIKRGVDTLLIESEFEQKLARSMATGKPLRCNSVWIRRRQTSTWVIQWCSISCVNCRIWDTR